MNKFCNKLFRSNKLIFIFTQITFILLVVSAAIFFVVAFKPLYYLLIKPLDIVQESGLNIAQLKYQYAQTINFILLLRNNFDTTYIVATPEGVEHFYDVRFLMLINNIILVATIIYFPISYYYIKKNKLFYWAKFSLLYYPSKYFLLFFVIIFLLIITIGFDKAFDYFHLLFFAGKKNYIFDPNFDSIISMLPAEFFAIMGAIILFLMLLPTIIVIIYNYLKYYRFNCLSMTKFQK